MGSFRDRTLGLRSVSDGGLCEEPGPTQTPSISTRMQWLKDGGEIFPPACGAGGEEQNLHRGSCFFVAVVQLGWAAFRRNSDKATPPPPHFSLSLSLALCQQHPVRQKSEAGNSRSLHLMCGVFKFLMNKHLNAARG